jgi:exonuclease SbcC
VPARRKEILSSILGLEIWETYRESAALRRRNASNEVKNLRAWMDEVIAELDLEAERTDKLKLLTTALEKTSALRSELETRWNSAQQQIQELRLEGDKLSILEKQIDSARARLTTTNESINARTNELKVYEMLIGRAYPIEKSYHEWESLRSELERWNSLATSYHAQQSERAGLDARIQTETARLKQEQQGLQVKQKEITDTDIRLPGLRSQLQAMAVHHDEMEARLRDLTDLENKRSAAQNRHAELTADYKQLIIKKGEAEERREKLASATGSTCPLCGQGLTEAHRDEMRIAMESELALLANAINAKTSEGISAAQEIKTIEQQIAELKTLREKLPTEQKTLGALSAQIEQIETAINQWKAVGHPRLSELEAAISQGAFCAEERKKIALLEEAIKASGYDADAHEITRKAELTARASETEYHSLEKARTAVEGLRRELKTLEDSKASTEEEISAQTVVLSDLQKKLSSQKEALPDLPALQTELDRQKNEENTLRHETGAAQQEVDVLEAQRKKKAELSVKIEDFNRQITRLKLLETAFGKDGIPALLIEQALPEIESQANEILDRLSDGRMSLSFETEKEYKDKNRDDKKPTLDILISDSSGSREYELFSGGEAFRINFAIRLALSRVLAGRAGARLRTLVIDEGFGSQDADGRQRLIEAINLVSRDFAKILVITHLEELKDAFPSRIEVTKTESGSRVEVIP